MYWRAWLAPYGLLGKMDEAKPYVAETVRLNPGFNVKSFESATNMPIKAEGLREAGFAEE